MNKHDQHIDTLLKRWISGDITAREEADLWDAARHDALLRDALSGYVRHADADHDQALARLRRRTAPAPVRRLRPWLGVAAALLCLVVAAWWITMPQNTDATGTQAPMAATEAPAAPNAKTSPSADAPAPTEPIAAAAPRHQPPPAAEVAPSRSGRAPAQPQPTAGTPPEGPWANKDTAPTADQQADFALESTYSTPAPAAAAPAAASPPSPAPEAARARAAAEAATEAATQQAARKQAATPYANQQLQPDSATQNAYPANGLTAFNNYVVLNSPPRSQGEWVTLRFDLDADGHPIRIQVVDASRRSLHAKAIELLRNGGPWQTLPGAPTQGLVHRMVF